MSENYHILCVCMGNICRSPTARALLLRQLRLTGLEDRVEVHSAGTHDYHVGSSPDRRAQQALRSYGIDIADDLARLVTPEDFQSFDEMLAMDQRNLLVLQQLQPANSRASVRLIMQDLPDYGLAEVPDPYYGGEQGFVQVIDMLEQVAVAICGRLATRLNVSKGHAEIACDG